MYRHQLLLRLPAQTCLNNNWPPLGGQNVSSPTLAQATCSNLHLAEEPEGRECSPACICAPGAAILAHNSTSTLSLSIFINQVVTSQSALQVQPSLLIIQFQYKVFPLLSTYGVGRGQGCHMLICAPGRVRDHTGRCVLPTRLIFKLPKKI